MKAVFTNEFPVPLDLFWDDGKDGQKVGTIAPGGNLRQQTLPGHVFKWFAGDTWQAVTMEVGKSEYTCAAPSREEL